jgi:hypothetical protein
VARRSGTKQERRSTPRGNSRRRPGDGVGGVGGPAGSRGASPSLLTSRASWCSYHREALTLLPLRDRPCRPQGWRPCPSRLAGGGRGSRVADGPAGGESGTPSRDRPCREWIGTQVAAGSPEAAWDPDGTTSSTPRGDPRHRPDDGVGGGGGAGRTRWASSPPRPEGLLVLIPPGDLQTSASPPACRWEGGAGLERRSTLRGNSRRRPGDGDGGVGEPVRSRWASPLPPQSRGPSLMLIPSKRALTFSHPASGRAVGPNSPQSRWPRANRDGELWPISR